MKFSQIAYTRVDMEALMTQVAALTELLRGAAGFEDAERAYLQMNELESEALHGMRTVAQIRRDVDTRDEFYDAEVKFYNRELPKVQALKQQWTNTLLKSPFRAALEEKYGSVPFLNAELQNRTFKPELVEDLQKESELVSRYTKLIASAQIPFEGNVINLRILSQNIKKVLR